MNIYYDNIVYHLQKSGGISRYWQELTMRFLADSSCDMRFIEHPSTCVNNFRELLNIPGEKIIYEPDLPVSISRYLPVRMKTEKPSVFHSSYYRNISDKKAVRIVTLHDFVYEYFVKGLKRFVHSTQKAGALRKADGIICISESTRKDLKRFFPDIPDDKITVIANGVGSDFASSALSREEILTKHDLKDDRYTLFIGERSGYKNFYSAVKASSEAGCFLLVIGGKSMTDEEREMLDKHLKSRYRVLGFMPNNDLCELYSIAHCLLYTSLYEGFGIPVLEAMKCGCPVVASYCSSLPEAAGDAGLLSRDMTPASYAGLIAKLDNDGFRAETVKKGIEHASSFSWDKCFSETKAFYEKMLAIRA